MNFGRRMECNKCGSARPTEFMPAGGGGRGRGGTVRNKDPERPRSEMGGSRGPPQMRPGDWACPMCMNMNWASRSECNLCQTKNPKLTEEKREGRAGGHFERQEVLRLVTSERSLLNAIAPALRIGCPNLSVFVFRQSAPCLDVWIQRPITPPSSQLSLAPGSGWFGFGGAMC